MTASALHILANVMHGAAAMNDPPRTAGDATAASGSEALAILPGSKSAGARVAAENVAPSVGSRRDAASVSLESLMGLELRAFAFGYDPEGDDGLPLLTVTIDRPRGWIRESMKRKARSRREEARRDEKVRIWRRAETAASADVPPAEAGAEEGTAPTTVSLTDLKAGYGPLRGTVVRLSSRSGAAFLDCGVTRRAGKKLGGGTVRSLGMLRFDDLVRSTTRAAAVDSEGDDGALAEEEVDVIQAAMALEEDVEEGEETLEEDVTDLFELTEDGSLSVVNETTGERTILEEAGPNASEEEERDEEGEEEDDDDDDVFAGMSPEERFEAISRMLESGEDFYNDIDDDEEDDDDDGYSEPTFLRTGDVIDVYVKAVHPQSGRYSLTLDPPSPAASNRKGKDVKREREAVKRLLTLQSIV